MGVAELRQKQIPELKQELQNLLRQQFKLRLLKGTGELKRNHQVKQVRRDIARVMTLITEKEGT
ncbi:MAG TPA: 50S ribosomal protein L29 [Gammaproteobacteria bacterium]|nr:50S ribosomal protein L29 [Gammaproteobacteria bacterium]